jgi:hypothetical protein
MIRGDVRIAIEKPFADAEDVEPAEENDREQNAEKNPQREDRFAVFVKDGQDRSHTK